MVEREWGTMADAAAVTMGPGCGYVGWEYFWMDEDFWMLGAVVRGEVERGQMEPVTMSQSQSAMPPGVASTAVCGE
jgi:hypothetical protein